MLDLGTLQIGVKVDDGSAKSELTALGGEVEKTGKKTDTLAGKAKAMIKGFIAAYAIKELVKLGKAALDAYAQFEQLEGGVNKIFGPEAAEQVMKNANKAYKTAGMSANDYMETVTNFSASLIQSMEGNTEAAAEVADMAIRDMSDNANTFGTNMQSIQDAYQGFAKQNYTMLDNLKLGYGGTKTEMERLLADAEELTGIHYDINNLDDVYEAIHVIQEEMNITGTTAKESSKTVEGSINTAKASWENLLTAIGSGEGVGKAIEQFLDSLGTVAKNVAPIAWNILIGLAQALAEGVPKAIGMLGDFMSNLADGMANGTKGNFGEVAVGILQDLIVGLIKNIPKLVIGTLKLIYALRDYLIQAAPELVKAGVEAFKQLMQGFLEDHPQIASAVEKIGGVFETVLGPVIGIIKDVVKWWKKLMGQKGKKKLKVEAPFSKQIQSIKDVFDKWKDVLKQKKKKTFEVAKKGFATVLDSMKSIWSKWKDILGMSSKKKFTVESKGSVPGHRIGLREVPYDGYVAALHKGEAIMTAAEVNKLKKQGGNTYTNGDLTVNVYGSPNMNVEELAAAVEKKIINVQKRRTMAWA